MLCEQNTRANYKSLDGVQTNLKKFCFQLNGANFIEILYHVQQLKKSYQKNKPSNAISPGQWHLAPMVSIELHYYCPNNRDLQEQKNRVSNFSMTWVTKDIAMSIIQLRVPFIYVYIHNPTGKCIFRQWFAVEKNTSLEATMFQTHMQKNMKCFLQKTEIFQILQVCIFILHILQNFHPILKGPMLHSLLLKFPRDSTSHIL